MNIRGAMQTIVRGAGGAAIVSGLAACPNTDIVRPPDQTYADAVGAQSTPVIEGHGEPLVVDWRPEYRGDLEVAMKQGVAAVSYGPSGLKLLKNCHIEGQYGFIGMTLKEQLVRLENAGEIKANLPLSGVGIAGQLGGRLAQGTVLDVAMAMVGQRKTTWNEVRRADLPAGCEGATHFVRGATVGAFVMKTASRGEASTAAEVFGFGASGNASSEKDVMNKDGDLAACRGADPDASTPPPQCTAIIRLELDSVAEGAQAKSPPASRETAGRPDPCPAGLVMSAGKCAAPSSQRPHRCHPGDLRDCTEQCDREDADSCVNLGFAHERGQGAPKDLERAGRLYGKACSLGSSLGCHNLGYLLSEGEGMAHDAGKAVSLFEKACEGGEARGCNSWGAALFAGTGTAPNPSKAAALFGRACDGGAPEGCTNLGSLHLTGALGARDPQVAAGLYRRACQGGDQAGCVSLGSALETGQGETRDIGRAVELYDTACQSGYPLGCYSLAVLVSLGKGVAKDAARAQALLQQACGAREVMACATLRLAYGQQVGVDPQEVNLYRATYEKTCQAGEAADCTNLGILLSATGDPAGKGLLQKGCAMHDDWACSLVR